MIHSASDHGYTVGGVEYRDRQTCARRAWACLRLAHEGKRAPAMFRRATDDEAKDRAWWRFAARSWVAEGKMHPKAITIEVKVTLPVRGTLTALTRMVFPNGRGGAGQLVTGYEARVWLPGGEQAIVGQWLPSPAEARDDLARKVAAHLCAVLHGPEPDDEPDGSCSDPDGHDWQIAETEGGGEGRCYCANCGKDGDG